MSSKVENQQRYLTPNQVAEMLMVSPITVRQWSQKGDLESLQTPGGHRRYLYSQVEKFARERNITIHVSRDKAKILIVDDDNELVQFLVEVLSTRYDDIEIETAADGFEAGFKVKSFHPSIVLLDLMMPGIDGFDVCERIKNDPQTRSVRIIVISGYLSDENIARAKSVGAESCLSKPIIPGKLFDLLGIEKSAVV